MDRIWFRNRLKKMSSGEIYYRAKNMLRFKLGRRTLQKYRFKGKIELEYPVDFDNIDFAHWERQDFDTYINRIMSKNRIDIFGQEIDLSLCRSWVTDPTSGAEWSMDYFINLDYRNPSCYGDPKIIWEVNRHQFLVLLGIAYRKYDNEAYAAKIVNTILDWIDCNPPYRGINWVSSLEVALRIITWAFSLSLIRNSGALVKSARDKIALSIYQQADFIYNYLSLYSSANNHLIGELTGLIYASFSTAGSGDELKWRKKAVSLLEDEVSRQFFSDGVNKEQSIYYQCYTMEFYFLSDLLLKRKGCTFIEPVYRILQSSCEYLKDISDYSGGYPNLGDEDGGHGLLADVEENKVLSILGLGTMLLGNDYLDQKEKIIDSKCVLLFGEQYLQVVQETNEINNSQEKLKIYPMGGYAIFRDRLKASSEAFVLFDFGPIGKGPISAHGHADLLSVQVSFGDIPFIIDPGTYKYYFTDDYRSYFKGTTAHNTISVNYDNQLADLGMFMWDDHPRVEFQYGYDGETPFAEAEHDGYQGRYGVRHRRRLEWNKGVLYLYDTLESSEYNVFQQFFHLHPDVKVELEKDNRYCLTSHERSILVEIDPRLKSDLIEGQVKPHKAGWYSSSFYALTKTVTLENSIGLKGKMCLETEISFKSID